METVEQPLLDARAVKRAFTSASKTYAKSAFFQAEVADRLFERLQWVKCSPQMVLDLGAAVGQTTARLRTLYPEATVCALDVVPALLSHAVQPSVCSEPFALPFSSQSVDLIFSNLNLHWSADPVATLAECQRVLRPGGLLFFTTLGADTLQELSASFSAVDQKAHVHPFGDMHDIGDLLLHGDWHDPVMDREMLTLQYRSLSRLFQDLKETGTQNALSDRPKHLFGKSAWQKMCAYYAAHYQKGGVFPASMELIYGHAWRSSDEAKQRASDSGEILVPVSSIKNQPKPD